MDPTLAYTRNRRFAEMQKAQADVIDRIDTNALDLFNIRIRAKDEQGRLKSSIRYYWILKMAQYLQHNSYKAILASEEIGKIGVVGEYCITIMYLDNHHQDGKFGVVDTASRIRNRTERSQTWLAMSRYIETEFSEGRQKEIWQTVHKLFKLYHQGMIMDHAALNIDNILTDNRENVHMIPGLEAEIDLEAFVSIFETYKPHKYGEIVPTNYLRLLITRAYLINAIFFQVFTELLTSLYGNPGQDYRSLIKFAQAYGIAQQLVNDNCDYAPISYGMTTVCKLPEDTFSDLRRGMITLPIAMHLGRDTTQNNKISEHYRNAAVTLESVEDWQQRYILQELIESKALTDSMGWVCGLAKAATQDIQDPIITDLFSFVFGNRYYQLYNSLR